MGTSVNDDGDDYGLRVRRIMYIDSHRHFILNCSSVDDLFAELEADNFERTVLFGHHGRIFNDTLYLQDQTIKEIFNLAPHKIIPFLCDIDFENQNIDKYIAENLKNKIFKGIGEILIGHSHFSRTYLNRISHSNPSVIKAFHAISEFNAPILIHVDPPYIDDFKDALKKCSNNIFIWAHTAYDFSTKNGGDTNRPDYIEHLLQCYKNLFFDISMWKVSPLYYLQDNWLKLFEKYNTRFVFGTDMTNSYVKEAVCLKSYMEVFNKMSESTFNKITRDNFLKLCNLY